MLAKKTCAVCRSACVCVRVSFPLPPYSSVDTKKTNISLCPKKRKTERGDTILTNAYIYVHMRGTGRIKYRWNVPTRAAQANYVGQSVHPPVDVPQEAHCSRHAGPPRQRSLARLLVLTLPHPLPALPINPYCKTMHPMQCRQLVYISLNTTKPGCLFSSPFILQLQHY